MVRQTTRESAFILCAAVVLGFSYTFFAGKGFFASTTNPRVVDAAKAGSPPSSINLAEAKMLFESNSALFVDSRHEFDFRRGHIRSALNLPLSEFDTRQNTISALPKDKVIIVYCDGAECSSSIELAAKLYEQGIGGVRIFFGGWQNWTANNFPTESSQ